jgi:hypothetical protein
MTPKDMGSGMYFDLLFYNLYYLNIASVFTVRKLRKQWNILSTRQQKHTPESIYDDVHEIRKHFPTRGAEGIRKTLRIDYGKHVTR